jgi:hypothetical protein
MPRSGPHMLPNLKIVICAVMFAVIAFAVTGAGVHLPETYTRIGEMPEIGRPMMQRMITDEPGQAQFHILTLTRRGEELDRLRERAALEVVPTFAPANPEPAVLKPAVIEIPDPDALVATVAVAATPALQPSGAKGTAQGNAAATASGPVQAQPATPDPDGAPAATLPDAILPDAILPTMAAGVDPVQIAALPPTADARPPDPPPSPRVRVPHLRPADKAAAPRRSFHRVHRFARAQPPSVVGQGLFGQPFQSR